MRRRAVFALLAVAAVACTPGGDAPSPAAELPVPRTEVAGARWGDRIVVVGGLTPDRRGSALVHFYDLDADRWERGPDLPLALHHTGVVVAGGRVWVVGGFVVEGDDVFTPVDAVWSLGRGEGEWRREAPLATPRGALGVAAVRGAIVAAGGVGPDGVLATAERLAPDARRWERGPSMREAREHFALVPTEGTVAAVGGRVGGTANNLASAEVLSDGRWEPFGALRHARGGIGAAAVGRTPCVAGGEAPTGTVGPVECRVDGEWRVVAELAEPRHGVAVVAVDEELHVIGGGPEPGLTVSGAHEVLPI